MPAKKAMSWDYKRRRWWKQYNGARYVVSCRQLGLPKAMWTKEGSIQAATRWWEEKQRAIDHELFRPKEVDPWWYNQARREVERRIAHCEKMGWDDEAQAQRNLLEKVLSGRTRSVYSDWWEEVLPRYGAPAERSIGAHVKRWIDDQWAGVGDGDLTEGEAKAREFYIAKFRDWIGADRDVTEITSERWRDYYAYLKRDDLVEKWSKTYRKKIHRTARDFVGDLVRRGVIPPIVDLVTRKDKFKIAVKQVEPFTNEELHKLLAVADERLRLYVLLGLNIGANQADVSELKNTEVDWNGGWIERKRTKTKDEENVPKVCYKVWPEVMTLLREHRSEDPERVLLSPTGKPLVRRGRVTSDAVRTKFERLAKKLGIEKSFKYLRKTGSSRIKAHCRSDEITRWYLGHGDPTMRKHYVKEDFAPLWPELDWLREDLGIDRLGAILLPR